MIGASGHGWAAAIFPLLAAIIAAVFGGHLTVRFARRRRAYEAYWGAALLMFAAGSFAMFLGVVRGWDAPAFRAYWLLGAVLNVPYLFAGEVEILTRRGAARVTLAIALSVATIVAVVVVLGARVHTAPFSRSLPLGKDVFGDGAAAHRLAQFYGIPAYFLLLIGLVWSVLAMRGKPHLKNRAAGVAWIAIGATIVAIGSGIGAARAIVPLFSVSLAAGVAVMYWGFLVASRPAP